MWKSPYKQFLILFVSVQELIVAQVPYKRHEYKYTFKAPYLSQRDGTVPFWQYGRNATATMDLVRLTQSLSSQKGAIWTQKNIDFQWFEVEIVFKVSNSHKVGADGLAVWYTKERGDYEGDVFGSSNNWNGLGLIFDSFDNDYRRNNPFIMAIINNGSIIYNHLKDGVDQGTGCLQDFRNKLYPTRAKIEYYQNVLVVFILNGMTNNSKDYEMCCRLEHVYLPPKGYFGISAATGDLADNHDVFRFEVHSLHATPTVHQPTMESADQQRIIDEYQRQQQKLEQMKSDYIKEHPDQAVREPSVDEWYETDSQRDFRQILQGQSAIQRNVHELSRKFDEVIGRQERTMGLISGIGGAMGGQQQPPPHVGMPPSHQQPQSGGGAHTEQVLAGLSHMMNELRQMVADVRTRTDTIISLQAKPTAQVQSIGYDTQSLVAEMRDGLNSVKQSISQVSHYLSSSAGQVQCPTVACVTVTWLLVVVASHLFVVLAYLIYRDNRDYHSKKFY